MIVVLVLGCLLLLIVAAMATLVVHQVRTMAEIGDVMRDFFDALVPGCVCVLLLSVETAIFALACVMLREAGLL